MTMCCGSSAPSVYPRESGDPALIQNLLPWVPACAGTNGVCGLTHCLGRAGPDFKTKILQSFIHSNDQTSSFKTKKVFTHPPAHKKNTASHPNARAISSDRMMRIKQYAEQIIFSESRARVKTARSI